MSDQKIAKDYIQDARVKLMDKFGIFGGGHELNAVFDSLNKAYDMLPASSPITSDKELLQSHLDAAEGHTSISVKFALKVLEQLDIDAGGDCEALQRLISGTISRLRAQLNKTNKEG